MSQARTRSKCEPHSSTIRKLEKVATAYFKRSPRTEGRDKVQGSADLRFAAGLPFLVPEILEFHVFWPADSGKTFLRKFAEILPNFGVIRTNRFARYSRESEIRVIRANRPDAL